MTAEARPLPAMVRTEGVTPRWRVTHGWSGYTDHEHLVDALAQMVDLLRSPVTSDLLSRVGLIDREVTAPGPGFEGFTPTLVEGEAPVVARKH